MKLLYFQFSFSSSFFSFFFPFFFVFFFFSFYLITAPKRAASSQRFPKRSNPSEGNGSPRTLSSFLHEYQCRSIELLRESGAKRAKQIKKKKKSTSLRSNKYCVSRISLLNAFSILFLNRSRHYYSINYPLAKKKEKERKGT